MFEYLMLGDGHAQKYSKTGPRTSSIFKKFAFDSTLKSRQKFWAFIHHLYVLIFLLWKNSTRKVKEKWKKPYKRKVVRMTPSWITYRTVERTALQGKKIYIKRGRKKDDDKEKQPLWPDAVSFADTRLAGSILLMHSSCTVLQNGQFAAFMEEE